MAWHFPTKNGFSTKIRPINVDGHVYKIIKLLKMAFSYFEILFMWSILKCGIFKAKKYVCMSAVNTCLSKYGKPAVLQGFLIPVSLSATWEKVFSRNKGRNGEHAISAFKLELAIWQSRRNLESLGGNCPPPTVCWNRVLRRHFLGIKM